jgi:hypothetical protein
MDVDIDQLRSSIKDALLSIPGVDAVVFLDERLRDEVAHLEKQAECNGAVGGLMPFVNTGVWETLKRTEIFVLVAQPGVPMLSPQQNLVHIVDRKGQIIGEYLSEERRKEVMGREDVVWISDDFVLYADLDISGEPYVRIPPMTFPPLEDLPGINNLISGSVSTLTDDFLRAALGFSETKDWTQLVGFDP